MKYQTVKFFLIFFSIVASKNTFAQLTDLARLEYSYIPKSNSEDSFNRFRGLVNYPIKTSEDCYLIVGGEYSRIAFDIEDNYPFDASNLNRLHVIDLNVGYTFKLKSGWRLGVKISPRIASTLRHEITGDDFLINGGIYAINDKTKSETINNQWSYNLGVPKTNVKYFFSEQSILQTFVGIDGYFQTFKMVLLLKEVIKQKVFRFL